MPNAGRDGRNLMSKPAGIEENHAVEVHEIAVAKSILVDGVDFGGLHAGLGIAKVLRRLLRTDEAAAKLIDSLEPSNIIGLHLFTARGRLA